MRISSYIRPLEDIEWDLYKSIRLRSLLDSPDSFSATYEQAVLKTDCEWQRMLEPNGNSAFTLPLVGFVDGVASGIAWGVIHREDDNEAYVYQMWVSSESRGQGLGAALLRAIIDWSIDKSRSHVVLGVTSNNEKAIRFYESVGFKRNGNITPLREGSKLKVLDMTLDLSAYKRRLTLSCD